MSSEMLSQSFGISNSESPFLLPPDIQLVLEKAEDVVKCFQKASITKTAVVGEIYGILEPGRSDEHTKEWQMAFQQFCNQLEQEVELDQQALDTGRQIDAGLRTRSQLPDVEPPIDAELQNHIAQVIRLSGREKQLCSRSSSPTGLHDFTLEGSGSRQLQIQQEQLLWIKQKQSIGITSNLICEKNWGTSPSVHR